MSSIPSPSLQFDRSMRVVIGKGLDPGAVSVREFSIAYERDEGYHMAASITKTMRPEPNRATVQIYNLSEDDRDRVTSIVAETRTGDTQQRSLQIFAAYGDTPQMVFQGDLINARHAWQAPDWVTTLEGGWQRYADADIASSFLGTNYSDLMQLAGAAMGMDTSTAAADVARALPNARRITTTNGAVFVGKAGEAMDEAANALGVMWSNEDGKLTIIPEGGIATDFAIVISPQTGLIGEPVPKEFERYEAAWLMNPRARPGRQILLRRGDGLPYGAGAFRLDALAMSLDTHGGDWTTTGQLRPISPQAVAL